MDYLRRAGDKVLKKVGLKEALAPDEKLLAYVQKMEKLEGMIVILKKNFNAYAQSVIEMSNAAQAIKSDVARFYDESPARAKSVKSFSDLQSSIESAVTRIFEQEFGFELLKIFDEWDAEVKRVKKHIRATDEARSMVSEQEHTVSSMKEQAFKKNTPDSVIKEEEKKLEKFKAALAKMYAAADKNVRDLLDGRFTAFDECFVRLLELQIEFFRTGQASAEPLNALVDNYRKRFPKKKGPSAQGAAAPEGLHAFMGDDAAAAVNGAVDENEPGAEQKAAVAPGSEGKQSQAQRSKEKDEKTDDKERIDASVDPVVSHSPPDEEASPSPAAVPAATAPASQPANPKAAPVSNGSSGAAKPQQHPDMLDLFGGLEPASVKSSQPRGPTPVSPTSALDFFGMGPASKAAPVPAPELPPAQPKPQKASFLAPNAAPATAARSSISVPPSAGGRSTPAAPAQAPAPSSADLLDLFGQGAGSSGGMGSAGLASASAPPGNGGRSTPGVNALGAKPPVQPQPSPPLQVHAAHAAPASIPAVAKQQQQQQQQQPPVRVKRTGSDFDPFSLSSSGGGGSSGGGASRASADISDMSDMFGGGGGSSKKSNGSSNNSSSSVDMPDDGVAGAAAAAAAPMAAAAPHVVLDRGLANAQASAAQEEALDLVRDKLHQWECNKDKSPKKLPLLLNTLHQVLWAGSNWQPLDIMSLQDLASVKKAYRDSMRVCHPDKLPQDATEEMRVTATRVTEIINEAWKVYQKK